jgi:multiple sugar transport system substrate-binding protein
MMTSAKTPTLMEISRHIRRTKLNRRRMLAASAGAAGLAALGGPARGRAQDAITLTQWYHQYGEAGTQEAAARYAAAYSEVNPDVTVEMVWVPGDYNATALPAALLTDEAPDVFEGNPNLAMVKAGQLEPLDDLFTEEVLADFNPINIAANSIDGHIYAVKMLDDTGLLYYRRSILEEAGVAPPTTMDELIAAAQALDTGRVKGLFLGNDGGVNALHHIAAWSAGVDFLDPEAGQITFDNERTVLAYEKVKELNATGALLVGSPTDWWDPSAFTQGLAAMQWTGLWAMPGIIDGIGDDFGIVPWPALDADGTPATFWGGWAEMVNARGQNVDAAKEFVRWLWIENTEFQQDWNLSYGFHVPPRISAAESAEPLQSPPPSEAVEFLNEYGRSEGPLWTGAMDTIVIDALANIVNQGADVQETVTTAAEQCQAELDRNLAG